MIPVVDIFSGPGGLSEGFSSIVRQGQRLFPVKLSIESKPEPFMTLRLRAFFRQFPPGKAPNDYYSFLRGEIELEELYATWPEESSKAIRETWQATLGECDPNELDRKVSEALAGSGNWVLLGGPPCQAYSTAGVVGNRTRKDYKPEKDTRYGLYREFIRMLAVHRPSAFVLENVPGMLWAKLNGKKIIEDVISGLTKPGDFFHREYGGWPNTPHYRLISITNGVQGLGGDPRSFVAKSEDLGLPQTRHRVIIVGVREDADPSKFFVLSGDEPVPVHEVISDLPKLRSWLSQESDSINTWRGVFKGLRHSGWVKEVRSIHGRDLANHILKTARELVSGSPPDKGADYIPHSVEPAWNSQWFIDYRLGGCCHHETRPHMRSDLHRYLFCACFGQIEGRSPKLPDFPQGLLPNHRNSKSGSFKDRFRVLIANQPSGTIISHLAKDGHAFIHPDPCQCRSLTPREAARIQTFPDNYYFFGGRSSRFRQIGNAVPPYLARMIAESLKNVLVG